ncbi:MAG: hypothetical protein U1E81_13860 [Xanthobacteraceae bacterium]
MRPKPPTHQLRDLSRLPKALAPLTEEMRWLIWQWTSREKDGDVKWTKTPFQVRDPRAHAKSNDSSTWGDFNTAVRRVRNGDADGIGYALLGGGGVDDQQEAARAWRMARLMQHIASHW